MNNISQLLQTEAQDADGIVDQMLLEYDKQNTLMSVPDIEYEPHLLISKVRKHYMEYIIKLLSVNYETHQRQLDKNIRLPSAIWRCAKIIEMTAAQTCMVVQIYRKNIVSVIKDLKQDTKKGRLYKTLYDYLTMPRENEKKVQTTLNSSECTCLCTCNKRRKRHKEPEPQKQHKTDYVVSAATNVSNEKSSDQHNNCLEPPLQTDNGTDTPMKNFNMNITAGTSAESHNSDNLLRQLEILFQDDDQKDDDLFEHSLWNDTNLSYEEIAKNCQQEHSVQLNNIDNEKLLTINQEQAINEKLASLAGQLVENSDNNIVKPVTQKNRYESNKWLCEEYFLKLQLFEIMDQLRESNRSKLAKIKEMLRDLFGEDSDDDGVISPMDEPQEFIRSCKERIAPWVVRILTPFYIKGRIKGKALFKSLAKHLIRLIYQCSKYPNEYEVKSFVSDFLENHQNIRCEADFKQFRIENI